jgi:hypothetical protein
MTHPAWVRLLNNHTDLQSKEISMGEPPTPTPPVRKNGDKHHQPKTKAVKKKVAKKKAAKK